VFFRLQFAPYPIVPFGNMTVPRADTLILMINFLFFRNPYLFIHLNLEALLAWLLPCEWLTGDPYFWEASCAVQNPGMNHAKSRLDP
jgi:hypothetical protein